jgi:hypothetical protein
MSESFASPAQLSARLGRPFDETETEQAQLFLTDATEYLRAEFDGAFINQGTASAVLHVRAGQARVKIPQWSVTNVSAVTINDREYVGNWEVRDDFLVFPGGFQGDAQIVVEFSFGQDPVPAELVMWTCVLAAGGLAQVNRSGTFGSSGVASEKIEDYAVSYQPGSAAMTLPAPVLGRLRATYGATGHVTKRPA